MHDNQRQTHWAYIAGIMDADGCFMVFKHKRKTKNGNSERAQNFPKKMENWSISYLPGVKIAMIESEAIFFILKEFGYGNYNIDGARKNRPNSKSIYHWYLRNKDQLIEFLEGIIPYLKVKKDRAIHLLKFTKNLKKYKNPCYRGLPQTELDYREDMYLKMREFNGNKVAATTKFSSSERRSDSLIS
ncbi:MAG: hypothetical protein ACLFUW_00265 [Bacteroidales bacterium]